MEGKTKQRDNAHCKKPFSTYQSFVKRARRIKTAAELGMARSSGIDRQWSRALCRRLVRDKSRKEAAATVSDCNLASGNDAGDEEVEIERRVKALQRLVPGGEQMETDALFEETADYIEALRGQVNAMRALAEFMDGVARERRMMGG